MQKITAIDFSEASSPDPNPLIVLNICDSYLSDIFDHFLIAKFFFNYYLLFVICYLYLVTTISVAKSMFTIAFLNVCLTSR